MTVLKYLLGQTRSPEDRTLYNAARPFRVIGGVSDQEVEWVLKTCWFYIGMSTQRIGKFLTRYSTHQIISSCSWPKCQGLPCLYVGGRVYKSRAFEWIHWKNCSPNHQSPVSVSIGWYDWIQPSTENRLYSLSISSFPDHESLCCRCGGNDARSHAFISHEWSIWLCLEFTGCHGIHRVARSCTGTRKSVHESTKWLTLEQFPGPIQRSTVGHVCWLPSRYVCSN